jgi:hypothetical protein
MAVGHAAAVDPWMRATWSTVLLSLVGLAVSCLNLDGKRQKKEDGYEAGLRIGGSGIRHFLSRRRQRSSALLLLLALRTTPRALLAGIMALVLAGGDAFHLLPRINVILTGRQEQLERALGRGKPITSVTMTVSMCFYAQIGLLVCSPRNLPAGPVRSISLRWRASRCACCLKTGGSRVIRPSAGASGATYRFFCWGCLLRVCSVCNGNNAQGLGIRVARDCSQLRVLSSRGALWANKNPKIGMLMLPKTLLSLAAGNVLFFKDAPPLYAFHKKRKEHHHERVQKN